MWIRLRSSLSVLLRLRFLALASSKAFFMMSCFFCIHFWYFWSVCFSSLVVFGSMSCRVPVLYSSLGCFTLR